MKTMTDEQLDGIVELLTIRTFYSGQFLVRENDVGNSMFIIEEGTVGVYKEIDGEHPQEIFNEMNKLWK